MQHMTEEIKPALTAGDDGWEWENRQAVRSVYAGAQLTMGREVEDHVTMNLHDHDGPLRFRIQQCIRSGPGLHDFECQAVELRPETYHALAALALYGQPFGFTREDVERLEEAKHSCWWEQLGPSQEWFDSFVARIRALLPPDEVKP